MHKPTPAARKIARRILAQAARANPNPLDAAATTLGAYANIRARLSTFLGPAGFDALMARSLSLASQIRPEFASLRLNNDGVVHGLREYAANRPVKETLEGLEDLVTYLIHLISTFIGEVLTERLTADSESAIAHLSGFKNTGETPQ